VGWLAGGALVIGGFGLLTGEGFVASLAAANGAPGAAIGLGEAAVAVLGGVASVAVLVAVSTLPDAAAEAAAGPTARHATANGASKTVILEVRRRRGIKRK